MAKRVVFTDQAKADIRAVPQSTALQILHTIARYLESEEGNVKRLVGIEPPLYRLRAQDHRVFFRIHADHVEVTRVRNRREAYR